VTIAERIAARKRRYNILLGSVGGAVVIWLFVRYATDWFTPKQAIQIFKFITIGTMAVIAWLSNMEFRRTIHCPRCGHPLLAPFAVGPFQAEKFCPDCGLDLNIDEDHPPFPAKDGGPVVQRPIIPLRISNPNPIHKIFLFIGVGLFLGSFFLIERIPDRGVMTVAMVSLGVIMAAVFFMVYPNFLCPVCRQRLESKPGRYCTKCGAKAAE
jgi:Zn finger protein HypA/HybF involved in hydrogenase expression